MAKLSYLKGSTSITINVFIQDSASTTGGGKTGISFNTASLVAYYAREKAAAAAVTLATQTVTGAWSSGGFVEIDSANMPGVYRLDIPDAALATGSNSVVVMLKGAAGMAPLVLEIELEGVDRRDATAFGVSRIDAAISTRASPTNITAGTITTVTNLTNAPTVGDLTAAMKTSVQTAADAAVTANGLVNAIAGYIDTEVAAIKAKTDNLPASPAAVGSAMTLTSGERDSVADALLARNVAGGSSAGRLVKEALYVLRNKVDVAAGTLTVYGTDDTTSAFTAAVTTTAGNPISTIDPA